MNDIHNSCAKSWYCITKKLHWKYCADITHEIWHSSVSESSVAISVICQKLELKSKWVAVSTDATIQHMPQADFFHPCVYRYRVHYQTDMCNRTYNVIYVA